MDNQRATPKQALEPDCAVSSTFNFSVGAVAVAVGAALIYLGWRWLTG